MSVPSATSSTSSTPIQNPLSGLPPQRRRTVAPNTQSIEAPETDKANNRSSSQESGVPTEKTYTATPAQSGPHSPVFNRSVEWSLDRTTSMLSPLLHPHQIPQDPTYTIPNPYRRPPQASHLPTVSPTNLSPQSPCLNPSQFGSFSSPLGLHRNTSFSNTRRSSGSASVTGNPSIAGSPQGISLEATQRPAAPFNGSPSNQFVDPFETTPVVTPPPHIIDATGRASAFSFQLEDSPEVNAPLLPPYQRSHKRTELSHLCDRLIEWIGTNNRDLQTHLNAYPLNPQDICYVPYGSKPSWVVFFSKLQDFAQSLNLKQLENFCQTLLNKPSPPKPDDLSAALRLLLHSTWKNASVKSLGLYSIFINKKFSSLKSQLSTSTNKIISEIESYFMEAKNNLIPSTRKLYKIEQVAAEDTQQQLKRALCNAYSDRNNNGIPQDIQAGRPSLKGIAIKYLDKEGNILLNKPADNSELEMSLCHSINSKNSTDSLNEFCSSDSIGNLNTLALISALPSTSQASQKAMATLRLALMQKGLIPHNREDSNKISVIIQRVSANKLKVILTDTWRLDLSTEGQYMIGITESSYEVSLSDSQEITVHDFNVATELSLPQLSADNLGFIEKYTSSLESSSFYPASTRAFRTLMRLLETEEIPHWQTSYSLLLDYLKPLFLTQQKKELKDLLEKALQEGKIPAIRKKIQMLGCFAEILSNAPRQELQGLSEQEVDQALQLAQNNYQTKSIGTDLLTPAKQSLNDLKTQLQKDAEPVNMRQWIDQFNSRLTQIENDSSDNQGEQIHSQLNHFASEISNKHTSIQWEKDAKRTHFQSQSWHWTATDGSTIEKPQNEAWTSEKVQKQFLSPPKSTDEIELNRKTLEVFTQTGGNFLLNFSTSLISWLSNFRKTVLPQQEKRTYDITVVEKDAGTRLVTWKCAWEIKVEGHPVSGTTQVSYQLTNDDLKDFKSQTKDLTIPQALESCTSDFDEVLKYYAEMCREEVSS